MRRSRLLVATGLALTMVATGLSSVAVADHVDSMYPTANAATPCSDGTITSGSLCETDNATLEVYRQASVGTIGKQQIRTTLDSSYNATDLTVRYEDPPVYTGPAETDIIYRVRDVPGTAIGITFCNDAVTETKCDQHYVTFQRQPAVPIACHETGHAVGLLHPGDADPRVSEDGLDQLSFRCMTNLGFDPTLGPHNARQINATY